MFDYAAYAKQLREQLHMYPEIGFDLPKTLALVCQELDAMGIPYTDKWGKSSVVATLNEEKSQFTIGLRADMDALPIQEATDVPFKSRHDGKMHACGHDAHTAILLAVAKALSDRKDEIACRVKFLFTPAEEYVEPGCKQLAENGVMDDIDCCVSLHVEPEREVGVVVIDAGGQGANSMGFTVDFYGKTAHAASQQKGIDAIMMAVEAVTAMEIMVAKEIAAMEPKMLNIGTIDGGNTNNVVCDHVRIFGSCRAHTDEVSEFMERRLREISEGTAMMCGGKAEFTVKKFLPYVLNDAHICQLLTETANRVVGAENISHKPRSLGGEDFGFLSRKKPLAQFRLGIAPKGTKSCAPLHNNLFSLDDGCFQVGIDMMVQFVLDNMQGIDL